MICNNILEAMGHTPMIRLNRMVPENSAQVLVKFEGLNVGGSIKTRTAFNMILDAEKKGIGSEEKSWKQKSAILKYSLSIWKMSSRILTIRKIFLKNLMIPLKRNIILSYTPRIVMNVK